MSSDPSRPDSPIPDLDLEVGDWSGSEKDLASRPVETVVTTRLQEERATLREGLSPTLSGAGSSGEPAPLRLSLSTDGVMRDARAPLMWDA